MHPALALAIGMSLKKGAEFLSKTFSGAPSSFRAVAGEFAPLAARHGMETLYLSDGVLILGVPIDGQNPHVILRGSLQRA